MRTPLSLTDVEIFEVMNWVLVVVKCDVFREFLTFMDCPETFRLKDRFEEGGSRVWIFLSSMWLFSDTGAVAFYCNRVQRKTTARVGSFPVRS